MANRYYYPELFDESSLELTGAEAHHLLHVMRAKVGDSVEVFDGAGKVATATISGMTKRSVQLKLDEVTATPENIEDAARKIVVASAVPKGDRFRWMIEKLTELGATQFIPLNTEHSVVEPRSTKLEKQQQYVIEACKQSGRNRLMEIGAITTLSVYLTSLQADSVRIVGHHARSGMPKFSSADRPTTVQLLIGPEGGFSASEMNMINRHEFQQMQCGPNILRTETAAVSLCAAINILFPSSA